MPSIGDSAPDFTLRDQHGESHTLSKFRGEKSVLLVFYPFAFTGVCTGEMAALTANADRLRTDTTAAFAISCDTVPSLRVFADRYDIAIPLLSDYWPHGAVASAYDAFDAELGAAVRASYVIDQEGLITWMTRVAIRESRDVEEAIAALAASSA